MIAPLLALALAAAQPAGAPSPAAAVVFDRPEMQGVPASLTVGSGSFAPGGVIPQTHSGYGKNLAPSLTWSAGPQKTRSYVVIVQDADNVQATRPLLHWLAYDIPADVHLLPAKTKNLARTDDPVALSQAVNDHGGIGWTGPHPPVGDPAHHYRFQVFALDRAKLARPGASFDEVIKPMAGHVLAKGEMVGLYAEKAPRERKPKKGEGAEANAPAPQPPAQP